MKIGINRKVLLETLEKGASAAISEDAQADTSTMSTIIKSVRITADKNLTIESNTEHMQSKYCVPVSEDSGIIVKEEERILVPAKELMDWSKVQSDDSNISISLQKFATPEIINTLEDIKASDDIDKSKFVIKRIGNVKMASKNASKTLGKWELECYDPEHFATVDFKQKSDKYFEISGKSLIEALNYVLFASQPKCHENCFNSVSIQNYEGNIYFATTDMKRCAIYKVPKENVTNVESKESLLINAVLLERVSKIINENENVEFRFDEKTEKIFINQSNLNIRLTSTDRKTVNKFPPVTALLQKKYEPLTEVSKNTLNGLLVNASIVNNSSALFIFNKADSTFTIKAISNESKYKPSVKQSTLDSISKDAKIVLGVSHLLSVLKVIKEDDVTLLLPENLNSMKVIGKNNDNFVYFCMSIPNPIYKDVKEENA